jgi:hypothetical protein
MALEDGFTATCLAAGVRADRGWATGGRATCPAWDLNLDAGVLDLDIGGWAAGSSSLGYAWARWPAPTLKCSDARARSQVLGTQDPRVARRLGLMPTVGGWRLGGWGRYTGRRTAGSARAVAHSLGLMPTAVLLAAGTPGGTWRAEG